MMTLDDDDQMKGERKEKERETMMMIRETIITVGSFFLRSFAKKGLGI